MIFPNHTNTMKDTILSLVRHAATIVGGYLLAKGYVGETVNLWLPGAVFILAGGIWGAVDEYLATRQKLHLWLSIARHVLGAVGGYFAALGKISIEHVETIIGVLMSLAATFWGAGDEYTYAAEHPPTDSE